MSEELNQENPVVENPTPEETELFSQLLTRAMANMGCTPPPSHPKEES